MFELRFFQNMYNHQTRIITTEVDYGTFMELRDWHATIQMRSEHTGDLRTFHWNDRGGVNKLYYYNEDMDIYLCVMTKGFS